MLPDRPAASAGRTYVEGLRWPTSTPGRERRWSFHTVVGGAGESEVPAALTSRGAPTRPELLARLRAAVRRAAVSSVDGEPLVDAGDFQVDLAAKKVQL